MTAPPLTVTTVLFNSAPEIAAWAEAIAPDVGCGLAEVVAVDNASTDDAAERLLSALPSTRVVTSDANLGFAGGANLAWPYVRTDYWLLLNPDAHLERGGVRTLVEWMDRHASVALASPELADPTETGVHRTGRALPSAGLALLEATRAHKLLPRDTRGRLLRGAYWTGGDQIDAGWVPGTALIARRAAVEQVGLMDPRYFLYGEDLDWCWRMRRSGWSIGVCSSTRAVHRESSSAHRSFASGDVLERIARGEVAAVERMRGRLAGRLYAAAVAFGLLVEAHHPRRSAEQRARARRGAHIWWSTCAQI